MVAKHLAMALLGSALIAAPALAQTSGSGSSTTTTNPSATTSSSSSSSMTQMHAGQWRASKLEGLNVYNQNNEKIGDISEMLVDQSGKIQAVVVGVGGFLGIGERDVALPFDQVKFVMEPRSNATASNTTTTGTAGTGNTASNTTTTTSPSTTGSTASNNANAADRMVPDHAMVSMTKEQLQGMPEFKYTR
ncbi:PRC-barrel domain-containing protein [Microvirga solisilvae]|uniref:PRC-barrel domain-containing protein n=1 Tax=Microvirga solisilvae TaxID=2919498 RepID=UPI001FAF7B9C|nr:PRC-barrel domain-containing protein [Microvirga solisilvae]